MNQLFNQTCQCFDFPVSWDFFRAHCWEVHGYDPGPDETTLNQQTEARESPLERIIIHRHSDMRKQEADMLQQAVLGIADLRKKLLEREKKKPSKYQQYKVENPQK